MSVVAAAPEVPALESRQAIDRELIAMAWPGVLALLLMNATAIVDIAMVGRLGSGAVAAVGYAAQIVHVLTTVLQGVAVAGVALMTRELGGGRRGEAAEALGGTTLVAVGVAIVYAVPLASWPLAALEALGASPGVARAAVPYLRLELGAAALSALTLCLDCARRARRDLRTPLAIELGATAVKLSLNALFIYGAGPIEPLGLSGAGLATVVAHAFALGAYAATARWGADPAAVLLPRATRAGLPRHARSALRIALPAVGERLVMNLALLAYFAVLARYGDAAIAAYAIGVRLLAFSWLPGIGFGIAGATLVGLSLGAGRPETAKRAGWRAMVLSWWVMLGLAVPCALLREPLATLFTEDADIVSRLRSFLLMLAIAQPMMGVHFALAGALRGAGDTVTPLVVAAAGNWALRVPLAWVAARAGLPLSWAWAALVADHAARSLWYLVSFRRARWAPRARD
ncbi:MAG: MATE family efflux transporter [Polyangiaceae bacterium]|nr:MATE family efflux transporter [Polyangiaceae bacterium]